MKNSKISNIVLALAFAFNICLFAPLEFYCMNMFDFWFVTKDFILFVILGFLIVFGVNFVILNLFDGKKGNLFKKIIISLLIALYIQGNFLNVGYKKLDGSSEEWNSMIGKAIINTLIWAIILIIPHCIKPLKDVKKINITTSIISIFILLIEIITLATLYLIGFMQNIDRNYDINIPFYLDSTELFNMSKEKNVVVMIDDTLEGNYLNELLEEFPEYKDKLKDFIYFDNATTASLMTYSSTPTLLTGLTCKVGNNLKENIKYCFDNTKLYPVLKDANYDVDIYEDTVLIPNDDHGYVNNKVNKEVMLTNSSKLKITSLLYKCVAYKYFPHITKKYFEIDANEFNRVSTTNEVNMFLCDDVLFNKRLVNEGITADRKNNSFKFYHLIGLHLPYNVNRDIEYDNSKEYQKLDYKERMKNQAIASIKILCNFIDKLKEEGVYDKTTIYFLADHGFENRYYVAFLVKPENSTHDTIQYNSAPISVLEDFIPTIMNQVSNSKDYGKDIWDYNEGEQRTRSIYNYTFTRGDNTYNVLAEVKIQTDSHAKDYDSYKIVESNYSSESTEPEKEYKFGEIINFSNNKNIKKIGYKGFLDTNIRTILPGTNISNSAEISIKRLTSDQDIKASFDVDEVFYTSQRVVVYVNDNKIGEMTLDPEKENNKIEFDIPKDVWNEQDIVKIRFDFPDCRLGDANYLGEETVFLAIRIGDIIFNYKK